MMTNENQFFFIKHSQDTLTIIIKFGIDMIRHAMLTALFVGDGLRKFIYFLIKYKISGEDSFSGKREMNDKHLTFRVCIICTRMKMQFEIEIVITLLA